MAMTFMEPYEPRRYSAPDLGVAYLDDGDLCEVSDDDEDERFHVEVSVDDVKLMTLEQLDDAYRLDIIDEETRVWKPGMADWLPLRVVAGIEDTPVVHVDPPAAARPSSHAPQLARSAPPPPPAAVRSNIPAAPVLRPTVAPVKRNLEPKLELIATPKPAAPPPAPVQMLPPAPVQAPVFAAPLNAAPLSVAPVAHSIPPAYAMRPRGSRLGTWTLGLAVAAGLFVTLYRNDVLLDLAKQWNYETAYLNAEKSLLGGPTADTLRSLEGLVVSAPAARPEVPQAEEPVAATTAASDATEAKDEKPGEAESAKKGMAPEELAPADPEPAAEAPKPVAEAPAPVKMQPTAAPSRAASKPKKSVSRSLSSAIKSSTSEEKAKKAEATESAPKAPKKVTKSTLDRAIADAVTRPKSKNAPKAKGSEFDPMNGAL